MFILSQNCPLTQLHYKRINYVIISLKYYNNIMIFLKKLNILLTLTYLFVFFSKLLT